MSTFASPSSAYNLIKVDPVSGDSSIVARNTISPYGLIYNNTDGLFYGLNANGASVYSPVSSFISINPGTGAVNTILNTISGNYSSPVAFDYCNNLYVVFGPPNIWIDPSTGKVVKQLNYQSPLENTGVY